MRQVGVCYIGGTGRDNTTIYRLACTGELSRMEGVGVADLDRDGVPDFLSGARAAVLSI
jgi:hypothetical protein